MEELLSLLKSGETDKIKNILSAQPDLLNQINESGLSVFQIIAYSEIPDLLSMAIELKDSFDFYEAIIAGKFALVQNALEQNASLINQYSGDGFSPISLATYFNHADIAKFLLKNGGDPEAAATNPSKVNSLHAAVARENYELVELFIKHGANVNTAQTQGVTPLHVAAKRGNLALVKLLVDSGANVDTKMDTGQSAMDFATSEGHQPVIDFLTDK